MRTKLLKSGATQCIESYYHPILNQTKTVTLNITVASKSNLAEAERLLKLKVELKIQQTMPHQQTLLEVSQLYLSHHKTEWKESTYARKKTACNSLLRLLNPNSIVNEYTSEYILQQFYGKNLSNERLNGYRNALITLIKWAYLHGHIQTQDFLIRLPRYKTISYKKSIKDKYLEHDEVAKLINGMHNTQWRLLTEFLLLTGVRIGEAISLKRSDIDLEKLIINIVSTYDRSTLQNTSTKTYASTRVISIQKQLLPLIHEINCHMDQRMKYNGLANCTLLFFNNKGSHISYHAYNKYLSENALRLIGRGKITTHVMRHTHTSLMAGQGVSLDALSRRLGHDDAKTNRDVYCHSTKEQQKEILLK